MQMFRLFTRMPSIAFLSLAVACTAAAAQTEPDIGALKAESKRLDAIIQYETGLKYALGIGVPADFAQAALWYRKAADQGIPEAEGALGVLYLRGVGVPQSNLKAAYWLRKAAEQGVDGAQVNLAEMYEGGRGVPKSNAQAAAWYRKAAEQGNTLAQFKLGVF